jgi:hypothetical protein
MTQRERFYGDVMLSRKVPDICGRFEANLEFSDRFPGKSPMSNFTEICQVETAIRRADERTGRQTDMIKVIGDFRVYAQAPESAVMSSIQQMACLLGSWLRISWIMGFIVHLDSTVQ